MDKTTKPFKIGRVSYIIEAMLEYLVSLLVTGTFLATITKQLGISDELTGIISSFISLGCFFEVFAILIRRKRVKGLMIAFSIINEILFMFLFVIPLLSLPKEIKVILFTVCILAAYFFLYLAFPKKFVWLMSLVDDRKTGSFTAIKEIISLLAGIVFPIVMGAIVDRYTASGNVRTAFLICAGSILTVSVLHTVSLLICIEPELDTQANMPTVSIKKMYSELLHNPNVWMISLLFIIYQAANSVSVSFFGTFMRNDLGFTLLTSYVLSAVNAVSRIITSPFMGKIADKKGYAFSSKLCLAILGLAYLSIFFAGQNTGLICFAVYFFLQGIASSGIVASTTNMIFFYVPLKDRSNALSIVQCLSGVAGFFSTLLFSTVITFFQSRGNELFGMTVYAQQVLSLISFILCMVGVIYIQKVVSKRKPIYSM